MTTNGLQNWCPKLCRFFAQILSTENALQKCPKKWTKIMLTKKSLKFWHCEHYAQKREYACVFQ